MMKITLGHDAGTVGSIERSILFDLCIARLHCAV